MIGTAAYIIFCLLLAKYNHRRIRKDKRIYHGLNGCAHFIFWTGFYLATKDWLLLIAFPLIGRLFFDTALNVFRMGWRNIGYVAKNPKSIIDKGEKFAFKKDGITPKIIYLTLIITLHLIKLFVL